MWCTKSQKWQLGTKACFSIYLLRWLTFLSFVWFRFILGLFYQAVFESGNELAVWAINGPGQAPENYTRFVAEEVFKWSPSFLFFRSYTKLADLAFLYDFVVKCKINSAKCLPPMGIEPATLVLWCLSCLHSQAFNNWANLASVD